MLTSVQAVELPHRIDSCKRTAVLLVTSLCIIFVLVTALYCYVYALYAHGGSQESLWSIFSCVSIDWLAWVLIAPALTHLAVKQDVATRAGIIAIVRLLVLATMGLGAARMSVEYALNGDPLAPTLIYFMPRYLFVTAAMIGAGVFYVFWHSTVLEIQQLKQQQPDTTADPNTPSHAKCPQPLVVSKGNCRVVIHCADVVSVTASGNYLEFDTPQDTYLMRNTMKAIEAQLDGANFVRIHRSHMVNLTHLDSVSSARLEANLSNGKVLKIGKKYAGLLPHFALTGVRHVTTDSA